MITAWTATVMSDPFLPTIPSPLFESSDAIGALFESTPFDQFRDVSLNKSVLILEKFDELLVKMRIVR